MARMGTTLGLAYRMTGNNRYAEKMAVVDVHGRYEIHPLPPDFYYSAFVFDPAAARDTGTAR